MNTQQLILSQIAEELPYLEYIDRSSYSTIYESVPILMFKHEKGNPMHKNSRIYIVENKLFIYIHPELKSVDLNIEDPVKAIDKYAMEHINHEHLYRWR